MKASISLGNIEIHFPGYEGNKSGLSICVDKVMRKTKQVRVRDDLHAYLKDLSMGAMTISRLVDKAILLLKKEKEKSILEYQHKMAILYPNRQEKNEHNVSKTQRSAELSTILRTLEKGNASKNNWTIQRNLSDNDNETKV